MHVSNSDSDLLTRLTRSSDNQAFGRVFRIGQEKESHYVKMVVSPTVDLRTILKRKSCFIGVTTVY